MASVRKIKADPRLTLRGAKKEIEALGVLAARRVAPRVAQGISMMARADFDAGRTAYGDPRPQGKDGPVTLVRTGAVRASFGFTADGTRVRSRLAQPYARYLVGRYRILPIGDRTAMPVKWRRLIDKIVLAEIGAQQRGAA